MALFQAEKLRVAFGETVLIDDLSFTLEAGQIKAIQGPSGTGKSSLLRVLAGLIDAAAGELRFKDQKPADIGWPIFRSQVLLVAQKPVFPSLSVDECLRRPFSYKHQTRAFPEDKVGPLLERFQLSRAVLEQEAETLSVGQQQRVALIRALILEPSVFLLDEATSALDKENQQIVDAVVRERAEGGAGVLFVSHDPEQVSGLANCPAIELEKAGKE